MPLLVFTGHAFLADEQMRRTLAAQGLKASELPRLSGDEVQASFLEPLLAPSLFGPSACIVDLEGVKPDKELMQVLKAATSSEALVALLDAKPLAARLKIYQQAQVYDAPSPTKAIEVSAWVLGQAKASNLPLSRDAAQYLAEALGSDLAAIASELNKLAFVDGALSREVVMQQVGRELPGDSFAMLGAATTGRTAEALEQLRRLLQSGEDPFRILGAVVWQYALIGRCVALLQLGRMSEQQMADELGAKPYPVKKALEIARQLSERQILAHLKAIQATDLALKRGQDSHSALQRLLIGLSLR